MKDDEKMRTYAQGFKDGWNEAIKQTKLLDHPRLPPSIHNYPAYACPVCQRSGMTGVVCNIPSCPSRVTCGEIGAAGSSRITTLGSSGANGPTGYGY